MDKQLQTVTTIAFLVLCVSASGLAVKKTFWPDRTTVVVPSGPRTPPARPMYQLGEKIQMPGVDFGQAVRTVVLVVRKGCRFCDESMPF
jgi:hypothetical protein